MFMYQSIYMCAAAIVVSSKEVRAEKFKPVCDCKSIRSDFTLNSPPPGESWLNRPSGFRLNVWHALSTVTGQGAFKLHCVTGQGRSSSGTLSYWTACERHSHNGVGILQAKYITVRGSKVVRLWKALSARDFEANRVKAWLKLHVDRNTAPLVWHKETFSNINWP